MYGQNESRRNQDCCFSYVIQPECEASGMQWPLEWMASFFCCNYPNFAQRKFERNNNSISAASRFRTAEVSRSSKTPKNVRIWCKYSVWQLHSRIVSSKGWNVNNGKQKEVFFRRCYMFGWQLHRSLNWAWRRAKKSYSIVSSSLLFLSEINSSTSGADCAHE